MNQQTYLKALYHRKFPAAMKLGKTEQRVPKGLSVSELYTFQVLSLGDMDPSKDQ